MPAVISRIDKKNLVPDIVSILVVVHVKSLSVSADVIVGQ